MSDSDWTLQTTAKHEREKILGVALGTDICPIIPVISLSISGTTATSPSIPVQKWMEWNERAHRIIQDSISSALLLNTETHTTTQDFFDALLSIHQASNLASAFYIFQQLFNPTWSGISAISEHIISLRTLEAHCYNISYPYLFPVSSISLSLSVLFHIIPDYDLSLVQSSFLLR
ncbi:hypothetical protein PAXRUDRAFT_167943 [Paxillus rubicundulus Ve08.2h10]|uniref:Uncharacterized protein n=1 Tax=Paxillus rubicundulus Ve08.2h10 TaxID=930991 RepID=A0A0D0CP61_9AGAM|nr:hypothetical protein PAXRUDRAFT_167943 [Paxillus rubicundulus Ve08.2h10]